MNNMFTRRSTAGSTTSGGLTSKLRRNKIAGLIGVASGQHQKNRKISKTQRMQAGMPDDIAKKLFTTGDLILEPSDYSTLWNNVSPARLITRCIKFLLDYEKSPEDMAKTMKKTPKELRYFVTCVLNSVTVFDLFSIMDGRSEALNIALEKFEARKKQHPQPTDKRIYKVLSALYKRRSTSPPGPVPVVSMVVDCCSLVDLPFSMGMRFVPGTKQASVREKKYALQNCHEEFPFLFPFLQNLLTVNENNGSSAKEAAVYGEQIFSEILKILSTLHHQLRMAPESIESVSVQALALMFMLKQFLTVSPTADIRFLHKAIDTVSSFKAWPLPFSSCATDLLKMLEAECRAPGTSLRDVLFLEDPELLPSSHVAAPDDVHVLQVHVLVDREDPLSNTHQALFETVQSICGRKSSGNMLIISEEVDEEGEEGSGRQDKFDPDAIPDLTPNHLRIRMVTHIISCDFDLTVTDTEGKKDPDDPLDLGSRSPDEMLRFYENALDIHAQAQKIPTNDPTLHKSEKGVSGGICKMFRESLVLELLNDIVPGHCYVPNRCSEEARHSIEKKSSSSFMLHAGVGGMSDKTLDSLGGLSIDIEENEEESKAPVRPSGPSPDVDVGKIVPFSNVYTPLMPPVQFKFWQAKTAPISKPSANQVTGNLYLYYKTECEQLVKLVNETVEKTVPGVKPVLKLVLMGSNLVLHKYLCAYSAVYEREPETLNKVNLRLYICPEGQNDLGRFLAWSDAWYKRHVYSAFAGSVPMAPQYGINETFPSSLLDECEMHTTLPVNLLREMLQHYVRTAGHTENVRVYDVQCWTEQDENLRRLSTTDNFLDNDGDYDLFGGDSGGAKSARKQSIEEKMPVFALTPNVIVPFITSLEIGILSQVEAYKFTMMKQSASLKDVLSDKEFTRAHGGGTFPELQVSYRASNLNQKATDEIKEITGEFVSISVCNIPEGIRGFETSLIEEEEKFGTWNGLTLAVRRNQNKLKDLLFNKTKLSSAEADKYIETMKNKDSFGIQSKDEETDPHVAKQIIVGTVSIQVTKPKDNFYILADGALVGPLKKITVGPSALKHSKGEAQSFSVPIQSFFPVAAFTREDKEGGGDEGGEGGWGKK
ncbi:hypothetical protein TrLO_g15251 [Triparma laevis f. longispina]|uniref:Uncharacterized protein n=1 Tax=Triparma laevis f. longispina TaxID=1714387 RepID=A0A9W7DVA4_9STRA|nr:hypothetical protein TrLO_g15251 [Triparma laevis f. longispina]